MPMELRETVERELKEFRMAKLLAVDVERDHPRAYMQWANVLTLLIRREDEFGVKVSRQMMSAEDIKVFLEHSDWFEEYKNPRGNEGC